MLLDHDVISSLGWHHAVQALAKKKARKGVLEEEAVSRRELC